jgi:hypothetical protein
MNGNGEAIKKKVKEWLRHADEDLRLAREGLKITLRSEAGPRRGR